jgi:hypothetical protein
MTDGVRYAKVLGDLRAALTRFTPGHKSFDDIVGSRDQVFARYRPVFSSDRIADLTKEEFTSFLYLENNHHWSGLYRQGLGAAEDMQQLRSALSVLLDEKQPVNVRFPVALEMVTGIGKGIATGILTVAYPEKYGVWNNTSEGALRQLGIWPKFDRGEGVGGRYKKINELLVGLCRDLSIDLWTLDSLWWFLLDSGQAESSVPTEVISEAIAQGEGFGLERQLEVFLLENWDRTPLAKHWAIFSTPEEPEAGRQYPTDIGRIDILAKHKKEARFLVIELKRNQSTDQTVGQALRYMGWVKEHVARAGDRVEALIIARSVDKGAHYALSTVADVSVMTYKVDFHLEPLTLVH